MPRKRHEPGPAPEVFVPAFAAGSCATLAGCAARASQDQPSTNICLGPVDGADHLVTNSRRYVGEKLNNRQTSLARRGSLAQMGIESRCDRA